MKKVRAIFDIGKTNKKCFLFDKDYQEIYKRYCQFEEIKDEDGHLSDDLSAIQKWIRDTLDELLESKKYEIEALNFSTYGASLVHLDADGNVLTPLYNYTKPFPESILKIFHEQYGDVLSIAVATASPASGMLNAGLQLFWLKKTQPILFEKIRWSLHFPQYLSYLFTGIPLSDFTSIGCHTSLWNYKKGDYHDWVYTEKIDQVLAPIVPATTSINTDYNGKRLKIGVGIHDSSAALLPYIRVDQNPFLLVSTGTWSISMNPYSEEVLTQEDLELDCLNYMRVDGKPVKAARLFLGKEYQEQVEKLTTFFKKEKGAHRSLIFEEAIYLEQKKKDQHHFHFDYIDLDRTQPSVTDYSVFNSFAEAFHQLMIEMIAIQVKAINYAIGKTEIRKIYIDGGFADNDIFVKLLSYHFKDLKIRTTQSPLGSALGAAMVITDEKIGKKFLKKNYALKKHKTLILNS